MKPFCACDQGITIADCSHPEMPLIYANEAFTRITGYSLDETLGKNCRFLQVPLAPWTPVSSPCLCSSTPDKTSVCLWLLEKGVVIMVWSHKECLHISCWL